MSEEEKKAIESLKILKNYIGENYFFSKQGIINLKEELTIVLNLIENQQKQIQDLKQINEEHKKLNGELREEINKLKKEKEDIIDLVESEI